MRLLLVTDSHGKLDSINQLVRQHGADAVIHAGDFGFYDEDSVNRLTERELNLRIGHSHLTDDEKARVSGYDLPERRAYVHDHLPLSDLPEFLRGEQQFQVPVYAIWGNHEDTEVVKKFQQQEYVVPGLYLLHDQITYHLGKLHLFGLGGNCLIGQKFFQRPIAGVGGRVWSVLSQYVNLLDLVQKNAMEDELRIFVSHVSPGREAFITLMGIHLAADLIISGHMGPPIPMVWNDFAIRTPGESTARIMRATAELTEAFANWNAADKAGYAGYMARLTEVTPKEIVSGRGQRVPEFCFRLFNLNLPDLKAGYALLEYVGGKWQLLPCQIPR